MQKLNYLNEGKQEIFIALFVGKKGEKFLLFTEESGSHVII